MRRNRRRSCYGKKVTKEDIFYYVYGVLHSPEYRTRFAADLKKMLPRIPLTQEAKDFRAFSDAGRTLANLHLNYETVEPWRVSEQSAILDLDPESKFKVQKMTFARPTAEQKAAGTKWDKTRIIFNSHVTISNIPLEAYDHRRVPGQFQLGRAGDQQQQTLVEVLHRGTIWKALPAREMASFLHPGVGRGKSGFRPRHRFALRTPPVMPVVSG